ncbi:tyrosine-type recombinase/integrase [Marinomonas piezotolerans]|nr:site-specific integrase [Marinomonas piezotolerans]
MISNAWLKANAGRERDGVEVFSDRDGLGVRASSKGKLVFQYRYRFGGKQHRIDIGPYPSISLKRAREIHAELRAELAESRDPKKVLQQQRLGAAPTNTVEQLYVDYHSKFASHHKKSADQVLRSMELYVFPMLGEQQAENVETHHWMALLEDVAESAPSISERILSAVSQMYAWGIRMRRVSVNPVSDVSAKYDLRVKRKVRVRSLDDRELRLVWQAILKSNLRPRNTVMLQLLLMWGGRVGELRLSEKAHFDLHNNVWTIPPENHKTGAKTGKPLKRPILPEMAELIKQCLQLSPPNYQYMFPKEGADEPTSETSHLGISDNLNKWIKRRLAQDVEHWSLHDLRSTARSRWSQLAPPHIAEIALGHALPKMWQTYDYYDYLDEQRELYRAWLSKLREIVA